MNPLLTAPRAPRRPEVLRAAQATAFVGVWVALGFAFHLSANAYLLLGVPLTVAFQLGIRRRAWLTAWVAEAPKPRRLPLLLVVALALAAYPAHELLFPGRPPGAAVRLWLACAVVGAFGAAYGATLATKRTWRDLACCVLVAGGAGAGLMVLSALALHLGQGKPWAPPGRMLHAFVTSLAKYVPVIFVLEEVTFRGVLDAHLEPSRNPKAYGTATIVACLWGLWHLPVVPDDGRGLWLHVQSLVMVHVITGVPLAVYWRRSGNLLVPGVAHALIDAVRNAILRT
ncbi:MAG TPA: CPBP family intramembrane glutamic endopeptidase [Polyangiaceae bacterium]|nr:CPBP family intramembrane glutamic endopeptidase [Polyangiaceae bacterium]